MDLALAGRTVQLCGSPGHQDEGSLAACAQILRAEGAIVADEAPERSGDATEPDADIVIAEGRRRPGSDLLTVDGVEDLYAAWDDAVNAVEAYRAALPGMTQRRWGRFVWIGTASAKSLDSESDELATIVSMGMLGLHKVVAAEAGVHNITANAVLRGGEASDDDVAAAVAFLCSQGAAYITGVTITVDGGLGSAMF